jgi:ATP-dependent helicase HrpA
LFSRRPPWVVSAELTETTKLYARTVAKIDPEWVERVGQHLLNREYNEPFYHRDSAHVLAYEKVTLFGLVLVPRRRVHYGPIDPKASRELFIRQGLVEDEYNVDAPWARNNRQLIREVELMEAKLRRRDVLVDSQSRFAFYDAKIPAGVYNGPLFEKWRRQAEQKDRRTLFMRLEDLVIPGPQAPADQFPDAAVVNEQVRVPLAYAFDPGGEFDGVTATVPLAVLTQLTPEPFEWLVPGHLLEKVTELIRTLPKDVRVQFVPVPETARAVTPTLKFGEGSLLAQLAWQLGKRIGQTVSPAAFSPDHLPDWLRMNLRVVDEAGRTLAAGRDLEELRRKLRVEVKATFEQLPSSEWHRDGITRWDFADLPEMVEVKRPGLGRPRAPGDRRPRDRRQPAAARHAPPRGRRHPGRAPPIVPAAARGGPGQAPPAAPAGRRPDVPAVRDDRHVRRAEAGRAERGRRPRAVRRRRGRADPPAGGVRRPGRAGVAAAERRVGRGRGRRRRNADAVPDDRPAADAAGPAAAGGQARPTSASTWPTCCRGGSSRQTPWPWLKHFPRYLRAIELRLKKLLNAGAARDAQAMNEVRPLWKRYVDRRELHAFQGVDDPALTPVPLDDRGAPRVAVRAGAEDGVPGVAEAAGTTVRRGEVRRGAACLVVARSPVARVSQPVRRVPTPADGTPSERLRRSAARSAR